MEGGMLQQSRFWAIVALFATFAAGGLLGWAVGTRAHGGGPRGWASRGGGPPGPDGMVGFLSERLDLTAAQRDSVRAILERHRADLEKIWQEVHPRFDSVRSVRNVGGSVPHPSALNGGMMSPPPGARNRRTSSWNAATGRRGFT